MVGVSDGILVLDFKFISIEGVLMSISVFLRPDFVFSENESIHAHHRLTLHILLKFSLNSLLHFLCFVFQLPLLDLLVNYVKLANRLLVVVLGNNPVRVLAVVSLPAVVLLLRLKRMSQL